jgi:hypothetical protein
MTDGTPIDYESIEDTPAHKLLELSHEELDTFIAQAKEIRVNATLTYNWLTAIKFEKSVREGTDDMLKGGKE